MSSEVRHFIRRSAQALGVSATRFQKPNHTIDNILTFFENGNTPSHVNRDSLPVVLVKPRLIRVGESLFAVEAVYHSRHLLVPVVEEAWVGFSGRQSEEDIPPWKELAKQQDIEGVARGLSFNFTSVLPFRRNLEEFAHDVLSPLLDDHQRANLDEVTARWLREHN